MLIDSTCPICSAYNKTEIDIETNGFYNISCNKCYFQYKLSLEIKKSVIAPEYDLKISCPYCDTDCLGQTKTMTICKKCDRRFWMDGNNRYIYYEIKKNERGQYLAHICRDHETKGYDMIYDINRFQLIFANILQVKNNFEHEFMMSVFFAVYQDLLANIRKKEKFNVEGEKHIYVLGKKYCYKDIVKIIECMDISPEGFVEDKKGTWKYKLFLKAKNFTKWGIIKEE